MLKKISFFKKIFALEAFFKFRRLRSNEAGFTYIELIISMVIITIGILGAMSALTYSLVYMQESEKRTQAKEIGNSTLETIFAVRDIKSNGSSTVDSWDTLQNKTAGNNGIFLTGWRPVRQSSGTDGIYGTADDACLTSETCSTSPIVQGYERNIVITDIEETNSAIIRKRRIDVTIRYRVNNSAFRNETISTIIASLPFN